MRQAELSGRQLVGREAELSMLEALLRPGVGRCAVAVTGEAGIGKTTIVRAALEAASASSLRVRLARPAAAEVELPYAGLGDLFASVDAVQLGRLASPQRTAVEAALARGGLDSAADEHALARGVLELLKSEGAAGDLLVVVDDVQWLDRPTAAALTFALRRVGDVPLRLLVAARTASGPPELPLGLAEWDGVHRLEIGALTATELGALVRQRLGVPLTRPQLEELQRRSGGNPMFALELVRAGGKAIDSLPQAVAERLRGLAPEQRATLSLAAAALRPTVELLARAGVDQRTLAACLQTGVVEVDGGRVRFAHPLLASAAYSLLLPDERRAAHARLATATAEPVERGHHVARSAIAPNEQAAEALDRAADAAARLGDHAGAANFLARAAELAIDPLSETAVSRRLLAAAELELAGDVEAAFALARQLVDELPAGVRRARARQRLVSCGIGPEMSHGQCLVELGAALEDAGGDEAMQAGLHLDMSLCSIGTALADAAVHARTAVELADRAGATALAVSALAGVGFLESMLYGGIPAAAWEAYARWGGAIALAYGSPRMVLGCVCMAASRFEEAERLFTDELAWAEEHGLEPIEVVARGHLAETQLRAGRWAEASVNARLTHEHAREAAVGQIVTASTGMLAMVEAQLGRHEQARALALAALPAAEATEDLWWTIFSRAVLGLVSLTERESVDAVEVLAPAWRLMLDAGIGDLALFPVGHVLAEALAGVGRLDDALGVAASLRACPVGERPWCRAMAGRCEALVFSARGDHSAARAAIGSALEAHAELPEPFEHARTLHVAGRVEHAARNWGAARAALTEALERFDALGAARWAERAGADLARVPGRRLANGNELSVREREVAELVAAGLSNREVAGRLFVSLRTVEANLSKAYAKLGVRSRTELAGRLARTNP